MPSPVTTPEFLELLSKSDLLDRDRLQAYLRQRRSGTPQPEEPSDVARSLVRDGLLTAFQANQLLQGKWRGFAIGDYKVLEKIGAGGMAGVYLCHHKTTGQRVAIKVLPPVKAEDPECLRRFHREARACAAFDHPNLVRAFDAGQDDKLHFLVLEYVDGSSLQDIVRTHGTLRPLRAAHYISQAAVGLQHAHEAGLVHRDIKPGNLILDRSGTVKILDMGLARFFNDDGSVLTHGMLGTADYLAPEQAMDSHTVDNRADIYSLGATFYYLLTGSPPFGEGKSLGQKLIAHQLHNPTPLRKLRQDVPPDLAAVVERMMAKDPADRYQTPAEVVEALATWTRTPIPPPAEAEMPKLSVAARGEATKSTQTAIPLHALREKLTRRAIPMGEVREKLAARESSPQQPAPKTRPKRVTPPPPLPRQQTPLPGTVPAPPPPADPTHATDGLKPAATRVPRPFEISAVPLTHAPSATAEAKPGQRIAWALLIIALMAAGGVAMALWQRFVG
jgi:serine/threonine protein kinase